MSPATNDESEVAGYRQIIYPSSLVAGSLLKLRVKTSRIPQGAQNQVTKFGEQHSLFRPFNKAGVPDDRFSILKLLRARYAGVVIRIFASSIPPQKRLTFSC